MTSLKSTSVCKGGWASGNRTIEYTYNDDGIRVSKHTWTEINDAHQNDDVTVVYLVDSHNHTGYAQVLEEMTFNKADPDPLTETPDSLTTYLIGDDVLAQATNTNDPEYLLYDGHEFIGCFRQDRTRDGFEATVAGFGSTHKRIPVRAWSYNSDVETVHRTIEDEFYDIENFESIKDFHQRVASYQTWYNLVRVNSNKDYKTPWQIVKEVRAKMDLALVRLPPLMLDWLGPDYITRDELSLRGYDVPCYP